MYNKRELERRQNVDSKSMLHFFYGKARGNREPQKGIREERLFIMCDGREGLNNYVMGMDYINHTWSFSRNNR